ncbi:MAG: FAD-dependent oxidoreductase [Bryobacteraceae bacterium]|nr:FAD-dependent oxidoreductase [Bryobacteraceae bacterium]
MLPLIFAIAAQYDVVVYGGSAAGVASAVQVSRMGRSVALVAPEKHIGGMVVEGLGSADINNHWFANESAVGGIAREFYVRVGAKYGQTGPVYRYESKVAESVVEDLLREALVTVFREKRLRNATVEGGRVRSIVVEPGERFEAQVFIDATIEGDLVAAAGVPVTWGREANSLYGETKNGIRGETTHAQFAVRVDPYRVPGDPQSGLIPTIQDEPLGTPGAGDRNIQAFCFRLCLTRDPANRIPFAKPANFDRTQYEIYFRYLRAGGKLWTPQARLPKGKTDLGSWHDLSANLYGMNRDWPNGDRATRDRIYREHRDFTAGLLWLLANDPEVPESLRTVWREWGLAKDEFTDNGGWPRQLYVRDGRRMVSDYVVTEHHTRRVNPTPVADPVAVSFWPTDTHSVRRIVRDGAAYNEGFVFDDNNWGPFGVSYRAMLPPRRNATNLISPTCLSASHVAYGAIRLEQTFFSLGQAAGTAAVLAVAGKSAVQDISYDALRARLMADGQVIALSLVPRK